VEVTEMMFWSGNAGWAFWQMALMWVFMIAFWGLLIWAIYALITRVTRKPGAGPAGDDAQRILAERLARGEIDADEYHRLRDTLTGEGSPGKAPGWERVGPGPR
jgi:putative membrane protein